MKVVRSKSSGKFWTEKIRETATWYPSLEHLNSKLYTPKLPHPIIDISKDLNPSRAAISIGVKLKIVTGTITRRY
jgi:hypothetical protein